MRKRDGHHHVERYKGDGYKRSQAKIYDMKPPKEERVPIPESDVWFSSGDTVLGRVIWVNVYGAKVELLRDPRIVGYGPKVGMMDNCDYASS